MYLVTMSGFPVQWACRALATLVPFRDNCCGRGNKLLKKPSGGWLINSLNV